MRNKISNTLWGLFFVAIGIGIAGKVLNVWDFDLFFEGWWTFLIIIPCFISMIQSGFRVAPTMGFIIGLMLFMSYYVDFDFDVWELIVPALLIFIGLRVMFQGAFRRRAKFFEQNTYTGTGPAPGPGPGPAPGPGQNFSSTSKPDYSAVFSSNRIHITDAFTGTSLNAIFGGIVLDLRDAQLPANVEINATAIFGGIDIYIPRGVNIKINNVPIFGGVSNKTNNYADPGAPTIYLNSTCMFGGIDIK